MSAMPLKWHIECLQNMRNGLERERAALLRQQHCVDRLGRDINQYEKQIARAQNEKKAAFDRDKYLSKK